MAGRGVWEDGFDSTVNSTLVDTKTQKVLFQGPCPGCVSIPELVKIKAKSSFKKISRDDQISPAFFVGQNLLCVEPGKCSNFT